MNTKLALSFLIFTWIFLSNSCTTPSDPAGIPKPSCTSDLVLSISSLRESPCGTKRGSFSVKTTGGDGQYEYQLNEGAFVSYSSFKGLEPGIHHLLVRDGLGCMAETEVVISSGTLLADVRPILDANCAVSGCHVGSNAARVNLKDANNIVARATDIKDRVTVGNMPPQNSGYSLTADEISLLTCWVTDGGQE